MKKIIALISNIILSILFFTSFYNVVKDIGVKRYVGLEKIYSGGVDFIVTNPNPPLTDYLYNNEVILNFIFVLIILMSWIFFFKKKYNVPNFIGILFISYMFLHILYLAFFS